MPLYTYRCSNGHTFDHLGKMDGSDAPKTCPMTDHDLSSQLRAPVVCGCSVERQVTLNAKSFPGADSWRK